jgi:hypothetical protein
MRPVPFTEEPAARLSGRHFRRRHYDKWLLYKKS